MEQHEHVLITFNNRTPSRVGTLLKIPESQDRFVNIRTSPGQDESLVDISAVFAITSLTTEQYFSILEILKTNPFYGFTQLTE
jgi:hypothetical protein